MHAIAFVVAHLLSSATPDSAARPAPVPDPCRAAAADIAALAQLLPGDVRAQTIVERTLAGDEGTRCLLAGWWLPKIFRAHGHPTVVARALALALASDEPDVAPRAAHLARILGVADPEGLALVLTRPEIDGDALALVAREVAGMTPSPRTVVLTMTVASAARAYAATGAALVDGAREVP